MASRAVSTAPASFDEAMGNIVQSISAAMMTSDVGPRMPVLEMLLKATIGMKTMGAGKAPGGASAGPPPGGMNIAGLMGSPAGPPTTPNGPAPAGMPAAGSGPGADDMRQAVASGAA